MNISKWLVDKFIPKGIPEVWGYKATKEIFHPILLESIDSRGIILEGSPFLKAIEEPIPYCFTFPLFSERYCSWLIEQAEKKDNWGFSNYDKSFGAYEQNLKEFNSFIYRYHKQAVCFTIINNVMSGLFEGYRATDLVNAFFIKYEVGICTKMDSHHDEDSLISVSINLDDDFEGSGLKFSRWPDITIKGRVGWPVMFAGNPIMTHQAKPLLSGKRFVLVYWMS